MEPEDALKRLENACFCILSSLDGSELSGNEYHELLKNTLAENFPDRYSRSMEHIAHWVLKDKCGMEYEAAMNIEGDASRVYIPKGIKITGEAIRRALLEYRDTIMAKLEANS